MVSSVKKLLRDVYYLTVPSYIILYVSEYFGNNRKCLISYSFMNVLTFRIIIIAICVFRVRKQWFSCVNKLGFVRIWIIYRTNLPADKSKRAISQVVLALFELLYLIKNKNKFFRPTHTLTVILNVIKEDKNLNKWFY